LLADSPHSSTSISAVSLPAVTKSPMLHTDALRAQCVQSR
jgi:hypothetical protein